MHSSKTQDFLEKSYIKLNYLKQVYKINFQTSILNTNKNVHNPSDTHQYYNNYERYSGKVSPSTTGHRYWLRD